LRTTKPFCWSVSGPIPAWIVVWVHSSSVTEDNISIWTNGILHRKRALGSRDWAVSGPVPAWVVIWVNCGTIHKLDVTIGSDTILHWEWVLHARNDSIACPIPSRIIFRVDPCSIWPDQVTIWSYGIVNGCWTTGTWDRSVPCPIPSRIILRFDPRSVSAYDAGAIRTDCVVHRERLVKINRWSISVPVQLWMVLVLWSTLALDTLMWKSWNVVQSRLLWFSQGWDLCPFLTEPVHNCIHVFFLWALRGWHSHSSHNVGERDRGWLVHSERFCRLHSQPIQCFLHCFLFLLRGYLGKRHMAYIGKSHNSFWVLQSCRRNLVGSHPVDRIIQQLLLLLRAHNFWKIKASKVGQSKNRRVIKIFVVWLIGS